MDKVHYLYGWVPISQYEGEKVDCDEIGSYVVLPSKFYVLNDRWTAKVDTELDDINARALEALKREVNRDG